MKNIRLSKYFMPLVAVVVFVFIMAWAQTQTSRLPSYKELGIELNLASTTIDLFSITEDLYSVSDSLLNSQVRPDEFYE
jgi:hypothetical protein